MKKAVCKDELVAVKKYNKEVEDLFLQEIRMLQFIKENGLENNFIDIFGFVETEKEFWIVMGWISG